jgi:CRP/FNR family transcriptional regulator
VFGVFSERLGDLMVLIDAIAFQRLDQRLADHLLGHGQCYRTTHQTIADELGTVREIITRLLNRFAAAGYIGLGRERIDVLDAASLRAVADGRATST